MRLFVAGLLLALSASAAQAAYFTVTKTLDTADGACTPADCSLREAVIAANATPAEDTIYVPAGTYTLSIDGIQEDAAETGDLDVTASLRILGAGRGETILDGGAIDRVLHFRSTNARFELRHLTVRGGKTFPAEIASHGAGAYLQYIGGEKAPVSIADVLFEGNEANFLGGGLFLGTGIAAVVDRCTFAMNTAQGGGGIYLGDASDLTLKNSIIEENSATGGTGGGLHLQSRGEMLVAASTIRENTAAQNGGGVWLGRLTGATGFARIEDSEIVDNESTEGSGGGVYVYFGDPEIRRTLIAGNSAQQNGGGLFLWLADVAAAFENLTVSGNSTAGPATKGGGLYVFSLVGPNSTFRNLTFADNASPAGGTQIGSDNPAYAANLVLRNSIVKGASACSQALGTGGGNVASGTTCGLDDPTDQSNADAGLAAIADNGGPTRTRALTGGAANPADAAGADCPTEDQRTFVRSSATCDAGAYESLGPASATAFFCGPDYDGLSTQLGYIVADVIPLAEATAGDIANCLIDRYVD